MWAGLGAVYVGVGLMGRAKRLKTSGPKQIREIGVFWRKGREILKGDRRDLGVTIPSSERKSITRMTTVTR